MTFLGKFNHAICFTRSDIITSLNIDSRETIKSKIKRAIRKNTILQLKKGLYITTVAYLKEPDKKKFTEYIASKLREPSYISLEYVLEEYNLLPMRSARTMTCITTKTRTRYYNSLTEYIYRQMKSSYYYGFLEVKFQNEIYFMATKAKALFDYLYLNKNLHHQNKKHLQHELFNTLNLQWQNFFEEDFKEFGHHVWKSNSAKMIDIWELINIHFESKKFEVWAKELLA